MLIGQTYGALVKLPITTGLILQFQVSYLEHYYSIIILKATEFSYKDTLDTTTPPPPPSPSGNAMFIAKWKNRLHYTSIFL